MGQCLHCADAHSGPCPYTTGVAEIEKVASEWVPIGGWGGDEVAVGDLDSDEKGSGARKNGGKVMFHQIPMHLLAGVARVLMGGMQKYKSLNWAKGMDWSNCFDCAMRHMFKWWYAREDNDHESAEHHLDHAICNLLFLKHYLTYYPEGDDRPPEGLFTTEDIDKLFDADDYCKRNEIGPYSEGT